MLIRTRGICCFLSAVLSTSFIHGEESICTVKSNGNSSYKIIWTISTDAFNEGQSFNLYHHTGEKEELVAVLNHVGFYLCHPFKGYVCQTLSNHKFTITSSFCESKGEFMFSADGEQPERCRNTTSKDDTKQDCQKGEASDDESDEETADKQESNTDNNKEGKLDREEDTQTQDVTSITIGISIGVLLTTILIVVILLRRNRLKRNNRNRKDELQKSTENTDDPLLLTKCNGQPIRPEDKETNLFILHKETSDHI